MKRFINKAHIPAIIFYPVSILFFELYLKFMDPFSRSFDYSLLPIFLYSMAVGWFLSFLFLMIRPVWLSRVLSAIIMIFLWVVFCVEFDCNIFYNMYYGIVYAVSMTGQVMGDFSSVVWATAWKYAVNEATLAIPLLVYFIFITKIIPKKEVSKTKRQSVLLLPFVLLFFLGSILSCRLGPNANLYTYDFTVQNSVPAIGLLNSFRMEITYAIFGTPENKAGGDYELWTPDSEIASEEEPVSEIPETSEKEPDSEKKPEKPKVYAYNIEVNFAPVIADEKNATIKSMHEYFGSLEPTKQNEYTGMFKGKNFIFITAEAFSPYAIDENYTPTLYKLANNGFVFTDYYQPSWSLSTTGGEFANVSGLIPEWINTSNSFVESAHCFMPYAPGHQFENEGYVTRAYHNNSYSYYSRDITHPNLGYDYKGLGNGLVLEHNSWPNSDLEMMEATLDEAISGYKETGVPFHNYYMSVSGHCNYNWGGNAMSQKNRESAEAAFPDSSIPVQAYKACNKELDLALEYTLKRLEEEGILNDTVICMGADHYPYAMAEGSVDYYKELSGIDDTTRSISRYKNTLILYCAEMEEPVIVDTPCYSVDIMPTICNLFGIEYDSRLYSGRDIFATNYKPEEVSSTMPLVIVPVVGTNGFSFVTAAGQYDAVSKTFTPKDGITVSDDYVAKVQNMISEKWKYARLIITNDYYKYTIAK